MAGQTKMKLPADTSDTAHIGIGQNPKGKGFAPGGAPEVSLPGAGRAEAGALVEETHEVCPYSNAARGNAGVQLHIV